MIDLWIWSWAHICSDMYDWSGCFLLKCLRICYDTCEYYNSDSNLWSIKGYGHLSEIFRSSCQSYVSSAKVEILDCDLNFIYVVIGSVVDWTKNANASWFPGSFLKHSTFYYSIITSCVISCDLNFNKCYCKNKQKDFLTEHINKKPHQSIKHCRKKTLQIFQFQLCILIYIFTRCLIS